MVMYICMYIMEFGTSRKKIIIIVGAAVFFFFEYHPRPCAFDLLSWHSPGVFYSKGVGSVLSASAELTGL